MKIPHTFYFKKKDDDTIYSAYNPTLMDYFITSEKNCPKYDIEEAEKLVEIGLWDIIKLK